MNNFWFTIAGIETQDALKRIANEMSKRQYIITTDSFIELKQQISDAIQKGHTYVAYLEATSEDDKYMAIMEK